ncbi:hypothetical protein ACFVFS_17410 [Kitasatospora sp. NPDC057692]|uniref:hypothetical protein n=1 Tax=Kitasatospora sp. NPDC057692 TaxID=3346215 RepID=UPI00369B1C96
MEKLIPEKLFPTERATAGHRLRIIATICYPVTGLMTGSPVLIRKLTAPQRARRTEAAELRAKADELAAQAAAADEAAFAKKLADSEAAKRPAMIHAREAARVAAKEATAEQAKADRKAARSRFGDTAGAAALMLIVGGPLVWSLARPLIGYGIGVLLGGWWIAALIHAPGPEANPAPTEAPAAPIPDAPAETEPDDADEWIQDSPDEGVLWALIRHTANLTKQGTAAHLQAVLDEARKRGEMTDWTVADLTEELASYGVPVVPQKKLTIEGRALNRSAVLLADLPEGHPAPFPAIVQPATVSAA